MAGRFEVRKNPKGWQLPYSVVGIISGSRPLIVSQHTTKAIASKKAKSLKGKDVLKVLGF